MSAYKRQGTALALVGIAVIIAVIAWFGMIPSTKPASGPALPTAGAVRPNETPALAREAALTTAPAASQASPPASETPAPAAPVAAAAPGEAADPRFDVVRVEPTGESVIAGRGVPGATVELIRNGVVHDRVVADASGLFAFVPPVFPAGNHEIILRTIAPDGSRAQSRQSVTVVVAENKTSAPVVALAAPDRPTVVLSQPETTPAQPSDPVPATSEPRRLGTEVAGLAGTVTSPRLPVRIASVDAEDGGGLFVSGEAAPGASVRLYLNDTMIAPGNADGVGRVSFAIGRGVKPGSYRVRLDDVDPIDGSVKTRAEVLFTMPSMVAAAVPAVPGVEATPGPAPATAVTAVASADVATGRTRSSDTVMVPEVNTAIVSRGDSLWRISRRIYGRGMRYTEIYVANQEQIRNPQLIYPGQLFVLPADAAAAQVQ